MTMEYNRQVPVGGAQGAEAAKAKGVNADQRDMAFATVTLSEKGDSGQARNSNVGYSLLVAEHQMFGMHAWHGSKSVHVPVVAFRLCHTS